MSSNETSSVAHTPLAGVTCRRIQPCDDAAVKALWREGLFDDNNLRVFKYPWLSRIVWWTMYEVTSRFGDMHTPSKHYSQPGHAMLVLLHGGEVVACTALQPKTKHEAPPAAGEQQQEEEEEKEKERHEGGKEQGEGAEPMPMPQPMCDELRLSVAAKWRGQGLGQRLHEESWKIGREMHYRSTCGRTGNPVAARLRQRLGYRRCPHDLWVKAL